MKTVELGMEQKSPIVKTSFWSRVLDLGLISPASAVLQHDAEYGALLVCFIGRDVSSE